MKHISDPIKDLVIKAAVNVPDNQKRLERLQYILEKGVISQDEFKFLEIVHVIL